MRPSTNLAVLKESVKKAIAFLSKSELDLAVVEAVRISHPLEELVAVHDGNEALGEIELVACDEASALSARAIS